METVRFCIDDIDEIVASKGRKQESLIPILQAIQDRYRFLPDPALLRVAEITDMTPASIEGVASFYAQFRRKPVGRHMISICDGTACHVKGATEVYDAVVRQLHLSEGEDTDAKGEFTVRKVACLGCCTLAPAIQIDEVTYGHVRPDGVDHLLHDYRMHEGKGKAHHAAPRTDSPTAAAEVRVGLGSCCVAGGSDKVRQALDEALAHVDTPVRLKHVSCVGMCHQTPLLEFVVPGAPSRLYAKVQAEDVASLVAKNFRQRRFTARIAARAMRWFQDLYADEGRDVAVDRALDTSSAPVAAFTQGQKRIATEYCGKLNPLDIDE